MSLIFSGKFPAINGLKVPSNIVQVANNINLVVTATPTFSSSGNFDGTFLPGGAFDGKEYDGTLTYPAAWTGLTSGSAVGAKVWVVGGGLPAWIRVDFVNPVNLYGFYLANHSLGNDNRLPQAFTIEYSLNGGSSWTTAMTVATWSRTGMNATTFSPQFVFSSAILEATNIRMNITSTFGGLLAIGEMALYGNESL